MGGGLGVTTISPTSLSKIPSLSPLLKPWSRNLTPFQKKKMLGQDIPFRVSTLPSQKPGEENPISTIFLKLKTLATNNTILEKYLIFHL